ncbi:MAG: Holliday junction branch migration DNA helicase RuvB [Candidatus Pacebacteria bacterium]|nr:Holliday junction branch migration DNA helicase RuvB [Candidatus Paceibacterota bacterium]
MSKIQLDNLLRPKEWEDYIGQEAIKKNLHILLTAAKNRGHAPEHILFYGPPGLGKTTLSYLIAHQIEATIKITSGPAIEKVGDLASILTNLQDGDILFIDEIHRLNKNIEEVLYPAMENGTLDIIVGKGPSARTVQLELPNFTIIAATTKISALSAPLRSRFSGGIFRLEYYSDEELSQIIKNSALMLGVKIDNDASFEIAKRSRFTPRTANYLLKRSRDLAEIKKVNLSENIVEETLKMIGIDQLGLTDLDRKILETIIKKYNGGPVGLSTISASIGEESSTIEEVNEPYLLQLGLISKTPRGREVTNEAYSHLNIKK